MANNSKDKGYTLVEGKETHRSSAFQLGLIAAFSAITGGLAVAWWHRKTLSKLQNAINSDDLQNSRFSEIRVDDETYEFIESGETDTGTPKRAS